MPSTPTVAAQPTSASVAMLPGDTTLTRISSLASEQREVLGHAGDHRLGRRVRRQHHALPLGRMGREVHDARPRPRAQQWQCERARSAPCHHALVDRRRHSSSVSSSNVPRTAGSDGVDQDVQPAAEPLTEFAEGRSTRSASRVSATIPRRRGYRGRAAPRLRLKDVGRRPTTPTRAPSSARQRAVAKPIPRPPPTTTAVASAQPEIHREPDLRSSGTRPVGLALLGERRRALHRVLGREDRHDQFAAASSTSRPRSSPRTWR